MPIWRLAVVATLILASCRDQSERLREAFVVQYLESVRDDTPFFRKYTRDIATADLLRARYHGAMDRNLKVVNRESYGDGTYDYGVRCGHELVCLVFLTEHEGRIVRADLAIRRSN